MMIVKYLLLVILILIEFYFSLLQTLQVVL